MVTDCLNCSYWSILWDLASKPLIVIWFWRIIFVSMTFLTTFILKLFSISYNSLTKCMPTWNSSRKRTCPALLIILLLKLNDLTNLKYDEINAWSRKEKYKICNLKVFLSWTDLSQNGCLFEIHNDEFWCADLTCICGQIRPETSEWGRGPRRGWHACLLINL